MDRVGLIKWATLWKQKESQGSFISKEATPNLFELYAKHIFSLPVNNVLAERQFNLSQLYLTDNMSELSKQASITFVENILHSGKTNTRTTEAAREVHEERMKEYTQMLTTDVLQEARKNLNKIRENCTHGPLQWKASARGTSALEGQRSFNPTVIEGVTCTPDGQVSRLMQLAALKVWNYGEELPIYDLPRECQLSPTTHLSTSHMSEHVTLLPAHEE